MRFRNIARNIARESAIGCLTHFLLAVAGIALLVRPLIIAAGQAGFSLFWSRCYYLLALCFSL